MPGLAPDILVLLRGRFGMAGTSPAMTIIDASAPLHEPGDGRPRPVHSPPATSLNPQGNVPILLIKGCLDGP
ncbi:hypothetical protein ACM42_15050 [Bradyrhizobium sp. CCBAU 25338]|nr:hypothetical protein [Bradyrhizobium sp. CCBAU 25338]